MVIQIDPNLEAAEVKSDQDGLKFTCIFFTYLDFFRHQNELTTWIRARLQGKRGAHVDLCLGLAPDEFLQPKIRQSKVRDRK
jgi:hypothetical protein